MEERTPSAKDMVIARVVIQREEIDGRRRLLVWTNFGVEKGTPTKKNIIMKSRIGKERIATAKGSQSQGKVCKQSNSAAQLLVNLQTTV